MNDHRIVFVPAMIVMLSLLAVLAWGAEAPSTLAALLFIGGIFLAALGTGLSNHQDQVPSWRQQLAYHRARSKFWPATLAGLVATAGATVWFYSTDAGSMLEEALMMLLLIAAVMNFWVHPARTATTETRDGQR
jgi:hypothetical protein